jgi:hypothetical protein
MAKTKITAQVLSERDPLLPAVHAPLVRRQGAPTPVGTVAVAPKTTVRIAAGSRSGKAVVVYKPFHSPVSKK